MNNNNMRLTLSDNDNQNGSTSVINQAGVVTAAKDNFSEIPRGLTTAMDVGYNQSSIYDFLMKPIRLSSFRWLTTNLAGTAIITKNLPEDAFASAIYADKIRGFLGFRAKTVVRLQVNGNRFQQGRLVMVFIPQGQQASTLTATRLLTLTAATQLPRVELDLATQSECIMEIPYISPTPYFNTSSLQGVIGKVVVLVYSPLAVGSGDNTADVTMWCHFENAELVGPIAQMADVPQKELAVMEGKGASAAMSVSNAVGAVKDAAMNVMNVFSRPSWALSAIANLACSFGYSKPTSETALTKIQTLFNFNMPNHNGVDPFPNMGLEATNRLQMLPGGVGSDLDEMSISHIIQKPAYVGHSTWSNSTAVGTSLYSQGLWPNIGISQITSAGLTTYQMTPMGYASHFFHYWRGSIVFTIKFVKTQYHSGRLVFAYYPTGSITPTLDNSAFVLREIVDIRETSEFKFVVPYVSTEQYLKTGVFPSAGDVVGNLYVFVLNELVHPDTVNSSIDVLVEVGAGPDMEYACPKNKNFRVSAQMDDGVLGTSPEVIVKGIGASAIATKTIDPAAYCIGEKINSFKQLLNRYCLVYGVGGVLSYAHNFRPFVICGDAGTTVEPFGGDTYECVVACYAYVRGSVRIMCAFGDLTTTAGNNLTSQDKIVAFPDSQNAVIILDSSAALSYTNVAVSYQPGNSTTDPVGVTIPAYQQYHTRLVRISKTSSPEPVDPYSSPMRCCVVSSVGNEPQYRQIYRAMGDDGLCSFFLGAPRVAVIP